MRKTMSAVVGLALLLTGCSSRSASPMYQVPNVVGMNVPAAAAAISKAGAGRVDPYGTNGFVVDVRDTDLIVVAQSPNADGAVVPTSNTVSLTATRKGGTAPTVAPAQTTQAAASAGMVEYRVTGSGRGSVTWYSAGMSMSQDTEASLPWTKTVTAGTGVQIYGVTAQHMEGSGSIGCEVYIDGALKAQQESNGQYAVVTCTASDQ